MKIKLPYKAKWEMIFPGQYHELHVRDFDSSDWGSRLAIVAVDSGWLIFSGPGSSRIVAKGKCSSITDGKKQVEDKLVELGMSE